MGNTVEKVDTAGCTVEQASFTAWVESICPKLWSGNFNEPDIHSDSQDIIIDQSRADNGWAQSGNAIVFTGEPDHVEILGHHVANNDGNHWAMPHIEILRNGVAIAEASALHMDDSTTYSGRSTINISFIDASPGINPSYTFVSKVDDSRIMDNQTIVDLSPITLKAICNLSGSSTGGTVTTPADYGTVAANFVNDNCQDGNGNAPFNLQGRETQGTASNLIMVWRNRPYATIPNLNAGAYTHSVVDNGDGTYDHVFTTTTALSSITITGGTPTPAGDGDCSQVANYIP